MSFLTHLSFLQLIAMFLIFIVAIVYSSAGFGGGSSYISLMALMNLPYQTYPTLALVCNLIVVAASAIRFMKNKLVNWKNIFPWIMLSVPMAFIGGSIHLSEKKFISLLATLLFLAGVRILLNKHTQNYQGNIPNIYLRTCMGGVLGLISGVVGIGGGIFLSPMMTYWKMDKSKNIAITTTLFIFFNSFSAVIGKLSHVNAFSDVINFWPILLIVFLGGQIGNRWCVYKATDKQLTTLAGTLSVLAACILFYQLSFK